MDRHMNLEALRQKQMVRKFQHQLETLRYSLKVCEAHLAEALFLFEVMELQDHQVPAKNTKEFESGKSAGDAKQSYQSFGLGSKGQTNNGHNKSDNASKNNRRIKYVEKDFKRFNLGPVNHSPRHSVHKFKD